MLNQVAPLQPLEDHTGGDVCPEASEGSYGAVGECAS